MQNERSLGNVPMAKVMMVRETAFRLAEHVASARRSSPLEGHSSNMPHEDPQNTLGSRPRCRGETGPRAVPRSAEARRDAFRIANRAQRREIVRHRDRLERRFSRAVSLDEAARDWIAIYAAEWRARFDDDWGKRTAKPS
ncbi:MAG: hypothetical protein JXQ75_02065 [Phycisphaerae bacterium]|nr:hypothetical protein [Phycisphaerae bacterium]